MKEDLTRALNTNSQPKANAASHFLTGRMQLTLKIRHGLSLHKKLMREQGIFSQENQQGKYAEQVKMLQEYVGELMIMLYEERKLQLVSDLIREDHFTKQSAPRKLDGVHKLIMLTLLDVLWSGFLKFEMKLKSTSLVTSIGNSPLEEFSIEAHKEFASQLVLYRQAVIMSIITPRINLVPDDDLSLWIDLMQSFVTDDTPASALRPVSTESAEALNSELHALNSSMHHPQNCLDLISHSNALILVLQIATGIFSAKKVYIR